jgi:hypothetical protein
MKWINKKIRGGYAILFLALIHKTPIGHAYNFESDSGLGVTAEKTGHTEIASDPYSMIGSLIGTALAFLGVGFLLIMIYGGYQWLTARGNSSQVEKAQKIIKNGIIGLIVVAAAYTITAFFGGMFGNFTN